jgi:transcriptional regulator with XRE-family HTH domain
MIRLKTVLASNIKARRKEQGFSQAKLAEKVDTAVTYIAMIESEKRTPSFDMIEKIAAALDIDATTLFSTAKFPQEPALRLREDLLCRFDIFLRAAEKEARSGESACSCPHKPQ